ncbi:hypothetical protein, partial [Bradyrhizobium sp. 76]|uniref:hypothetical protein n=1 Tax=Bradyrhizobium sp. 76 TaxID=2782680 RepID=UPI001FFA91A3
PKPPLPERVRCRPRYEGHPSKARASPCGENRAYFAAGFRDYKTGGNEVEMSRDQRVVKNLSGMLESRNATPGEAALIVSRDRDARIG